MYEEERTVYGTERRQEHLEILDRLQAIEDNQKQMAAILNPMNESYQAAVRIGKWASALMIFLSIMIGIVLSLRDLFKK